MGLKAFVDDAWVLPLGSANAVLLRHGDELALIDAGFPGKEGIVLAAIAELGRRPSDLKHLIFTHGHPDHVGSAAAIVRATGARTTMHAADAPLAEAGGPFRPMAPAPGLAKRAMFKLFWKPGEPMPPFKIDAFIPDDGVLPLMGGLRAVPMPGHCAGQVALMWGEGRLLAGGDVFMNMFGIGDPIGFEDEAEGRRSQRRLAALSFGAVAFGHGPAIAKGAAARVRAAAGLPRRG